MEAHEDIEVEGVGVGLRNDSAPSLLDQLAERRRELSSTRETMIPVPGYDREDTMLLAKYRLLEGTELSRIGDKVRRDTKNKWDRQINAALDIFVAACEGFYIDMGQGEPPQPVTFEGNPITGFTEELARALQYFDELPTPVTARHVAYGLFAKNDVAINTHSYMLNRWFSDTSLDVSREFMEGNL